MSEELPDLDAIRKKWEEARGAEFESVATPAGLGTGTGDTTSLRQYILKGFAEIVMWGGGCEASTCTRINCQRDGDLVRAKIDIEGPDMLHLQTCAISLRVFRDLLCEVHRQQNTPMSAEIVDSTSTGSLSVKAQMDGWALDYQEAEDKAKLRTLSDLILAILHALGAPVRPVMHPLGDD